MDKQPDKQKPQFVEMVNAADQKPAAVVQPQFMLQWLGNVDNRPVFFQPKSIKDLGFQSPAAIRLKMLILNEQIIDGCQEKNQRPKTA